MDNKIKRYDLMFYDELEEKHLYGISKDVSKADLYFVYKDKAYNSSNFNECSSADFDAMMKKEDGDYIYIKYFDDDTVSVGENR